MDAILDNEDLMSLFPAVLAALVAVVIVLLGIRPLRDLRFAWRTRRAGAPVHFVEIIGMRLRRIDPIRVGECRLRAHRAGLDIPTATLETHALAGGRIEALVDAIITMRETGLDLPFSVASALDLAGRDLSSDVASAIEPRKVRTPTIEARDRRIRATSMDGTPLGVRVESTIRVDLSRVVGGGDLDAFHRWVERTVISACEREPRASLLADTSALEAALTTADSGTPWRVERAAVRIDSV
ncbi:MAG: flotillin-like FloA family protein [Phycisphaerales bacterium]|nr:flotillin-like FloA family protein [Phycisphaerales bacterium]